MWSETPFHNWNTLISTLAHSSQCWGWCKLPTWINNMKLADHQQLLLHHCRFINLTIAVLCLLVGCQCLLGPGNFAPDIVATIQLSTVVLPGLQQVAGTTVTRHPILSCRVREGPEFPLRLGHYSGVWNSTVSQLRLELCIKCQCCSFWLAWSRLWDLRHNKYRKSSHYFVCLFS